MKRKPSNDSTEPPSVFGSTPLRSLLQQAAKWLVQEYQADGEGSADEPSPSASTDKLKKQQAPCPSQRD